jgi:hypothetical protein
MSQIAAEAMPPADESSRDSLVIVQQAAKALTPVDPSLASTQRATVDEPVPEPLMIPLAMVVLDEFRERSLKVALTKRYEPIEALVFDRPHEAFSVRVRIGRPKRRLHDMYAGIGQQLSHVLTSLSVSIADQYATVAQGPVRYGQRATDLAHEQIIGIRCRPDNLDAP